MGNHTQEAKSTLKDQNNLENAHESITRFNMNNMRINSLEHDLRNENPKTKPSTC